MKDTTKKGCSVCVCVALEGLPRESGRGVKSSKGAASEEMRNRLLIIYVSRGLDGEGTSDHGRAGRRAADEFVFDDRTSQSAFSDNRKVHTHTRGCKPSVSAVVNATIFWSLQTRDVWRCETRTRLNSPSRTARLKRHLRTKSIDAYKTKMFRKRI